MKILWVTNIFPLRLQIHFQGESILFIMLKGNNGRKVLCALASLHLHDSIFSHPTCPLLPITPAFKRLN